jgi:hypothetical protein
VATAHKYDPSTGPIAGEDFRDGHQNYLRDAIRLFYLYGQRAIAEYYYEYLRVNYRLRDGNVNEQYLMPLADFVEDPEFTERLTDPRVAISAITSYLDQAMLLLVKGDREASNGLIGHARKLYEYYKKRHEHAPEERMKLPPFETIFNDAVTGRMVAGGSEEMLFIKARLWERLPIRTQLALYDNVIGLLRQQAAAFGRQEDVDRLFAAPPGLEEHRKQMATGRGIEQEATGQIEREADQAQSAEELKQRSRQSQMDKSLPTTPAVPSK